MRHHEFLTAASVPGPGPPAGHGKQPELAMFEGGIMIPSRTMGSEPNISSRISPVKNQNVCTETYSDVQATDPCSAVHNFF